MCLGVPGFVVEVHGNVALVDFFGAYRHVRLELVDQPVSPGDYILNHVGYAIRRIRRQIELEGNLPFVARVRAIEQQRTERVEIASEAVRGRRVEPVPDHRRDDVPVDGRQMVEDGCHALNELLADSTPETRSRSSAGSIARLMRQSKGSDLLPAPA